MLSPFKAEVRQQTFPQSSTDLNVSTKTRFSAVLFTVCPMVYGCKATLKEQI